MEDITDADYTHAKRGCKDSDIKCWIEYHDLCPPSNTLLLTDAFENFRNMSLKIYKLNSARTPAEIWFAWQGALKKTKIKIKLDLLFYIHMLFMVEKCIRGETCNAIHYYVKASNKYMKNYDKNKESSYLNYWQVNKFYGWAMSQMLPSHSFKWVKNTSQLVKIL